MVILTSDVQGDWVANSVSLGVVCHAGIDARHFFAHPLEDQTLVAYDDAFLRIRHERLVLKIAMRCV